MQYKNLFISKLITSQKITIALRKRQRNLGENFQTTIQYLLYSVIVAVLF